MGSDKPFALKLRALIFADGFSDAYDVGNKIREAIRGAGMRVEEIDVEVDALHADALAQVYIAPLLTGVGDEEE